MNAAAPPAPVTDRALAFAYYAPATNTGGIYVIDDRGLVPRAVTTSADAYLSVVWSPTADSLVYTAGSEGRIGLYRISPAGGEPTLLADVGDGWIDAPLVDPSGTWVAFTRIDQKGEGTLHLVGMDGTGERTLESVRDVDDPSRHPCFDGSPVARRATSWSPDGRELLVEAKTVGCESDYSSIATVIVADDRLTQPGFRQGSRGRLSPDGQRTAFKDDRGLVVEDRSTGAVTVAGVARDPAWGPNGELSFVAARSWEDESSYGVWFTPSPGVDEPRLVAEPGFVVSTPGWSSDGQQIAFLTHPGNRVELWVAAPNDGASEPHPVSTFRSGYVHDFDYVPGGVQ